MMASQDVIELGSSEDEAEPSVKKMKPIPNAMVQFPIKIQGVKNSCLKLPNVKLPNVKIPGVTIKPAKTNIHQVSQQLSEKNVTITKITKCINYPQNRNKIIKVKPVQKVTISKPPASSMQKRNSINPFNIMGKLSSHIAINKVPMTSNVNKNPIRIRSHNTLNNLPSSVTVKRTIPNMKRTATMNVINPVQKKMKVNLGLETSIGKVLTVELDDDDTCSTTNVAPQWYIRPEDDTAAKMEEKNNKEPDKSEMVEITIEDSPIKPCTKKTEEVTSVLSVIIEDSPIKSITDEKTASSRNSDCKSVPHSKKKLEYPTNIQSGAERIEIEISPIVDGAQLPIAKDNYNKELDTVIEIEESPLKVDASITSTPKKEEKLQLTTAKTVKYLQEDDRLAEFNPIYREFIKLCFQLEDSEDMKKIVEKKIMSYYRQVSKEYTDSECFTDMVSSKILSMKAGPEKMYLYIKDVVDDLNWQRKLIKTQVSKDVQDKNLVADNDDKEKIGETEYDSKRQRQIRRLEKTLKKLHRAIQKLETQEVDFDDDEDSVYLLTERYKERLVKVHAKFCQLTNTKMPSEPHVPIDARPGRPAGPAKRLEKWINKKVPIGTPLPFPDFHDVLRCVREANEEEHLGWNEVDIMEEARDLFTRCGKTLQRRRQENEWRLAASRISTVVDPADNSDELKQLLEENKRMAAKKESEVLNKYADRQSQLKLEAEEIGDKEAEESPVETDEEEPVVVLPLVNKEERKRRLKRLLEEKSSKANQEEECLVAKSNEQDNNSEVENKNIYNEDGKINTECDMSSNHKSESNAHINQLIEDTKQSDDTSKADIENQNLSKDDLVQSNLQQKAIDDENHQTSKDKGEIHFLSDNSNNLESDIDELHLLQKLYSENEAPSSSPESSDSESAIAISDTLSSSAEDNNREYDVISIENSTYSESEARNDEICKNDENIDTISTVSNFKADNAYVEDFEIECSTDGVHKKNITTNNYEYNESIEDILLASSDDEKENDEFKSERANDTVVHDHGQNMQEDTKSVESVTIVSEKDYDENESKKDELENDKPKSQKIGDVMNQGHGQGSKQDCNLIQEDARSVDSVTVISLKGDDENESINGDPEYYTSKSEKEGDPIAQEHIHNITRDCNSIQEDTRSIESVTVISEKDDDNENLNSETRSTVVCDKEIMHESCNDIQDNSNLNIKLFEVPDSRDKLKKTIITEIDDINKQTVNDVYIEPAHCNLSSKLDLECKSNKENIKLDTHD
ncbi:hypothetical protein ACJJTC_010094 [Scirpophaga incertulas]